MNWEQEHDGSHQGPNAKSFRKYLLFLDSPIDSEEENLTAMELGVATKEPEKSAEELKKGVEESEGCAWEMNMHSFYRPIVSDTDMDSENWSEADRFFNR